jgi:nucleoside-diphosphate-sugar epimerase
MKIVVIGATGTIGTAVANALEPKHEVIRVSRTGPGWIRETLIKLHLKPDAGTPVSVVAETT